MHSQSHENDLQHRFVGAFVPLPDLHIYLSELCAKSHKHVNKFHYHIKSLPGLLVLLFYLFIYLYFSLIQLLFLFCFNVSFCSIVVSFCFSEFSSFSLLHFLFNSVLYS